MTPDSDATGFKDPQLDAAELQTILISARNLIAELKRSQVDIQWLEITPQLQRAIYTLHSYTKD